MKVDVIGGGPGRALFRDPGEEGLAADAASPSTSATGRTTPSASASCSPTRRSRPSRSTTARATGRSPTNFAYWDDIEIHFKGTVHRIGGNGFCGCSRVTLLRLLQERARALGVELKFQTEIDPDAHARRRPDRRGRRHQLAHPREASPTRSSRASTCGPNKFTWMGSTRPFDAFTFFFRETEHGIFIAHCYQYEPGRSTWVLETDPETFARAGPRPARRGRSRRASSKACSPRSSPATS